jgi:hypothetical protein
MAQPNDTVNVDEFGDFQTPVSLATQICRLLADRGEVPASVVEPTCGVGNFLLAAFEQYPGLRSAIGVEIKSDYVDILKGKLRRCDYAAKVTVIQESFFNVDWAAVFRDLPEPILVIGNPPWVTNSALGVLGSTNLPKKSNFQKHVGLEALTGKSNFDISEWMLIKLLETLNGRNASLAMLCKTAVARKVLVHTWKNAISLSAAKMHSVDAARHFDAAVDACLLTCALSPSSHQRDCRVYRRLGDNDPATVMGYHDNELLADVSAYHRWRHLAGEDFYYKWRSGVKHDCSKVMELRKEGHRFRNRLNERFELEDEYVYPMLKSSEITDGRGEDPSRWMLVTQRAVGEETAIIRETAPKTWAYLQRHSDLLDRRASSIYRGRPRFSVFGVGDYTFAPWKVAISGFYKDLHFTVVGGFLDKPIVLDDTCYFVPCQSKAEADSVASLLNSATAREFFSATIFWDAKRPITIETLRRLDLSALAIELGSEETLIQVSGKKQPAQAYVRAKCSHR